MATISDKQIEELRSEAGAAGDAKQVTICDRALAGSERARRECARVIALKPQPQLPRRKMSDIAAMIAEGHNR